MSTGQAWYDVFPEQAPDPRKEWTDPAFLEELRGWIAGTTGPVSALESVKLRPWASVWRAETGSGVFYVKENCAGQAFEAALLAELSSWAPDLVVPPLAVDRGRGRLLTADQGPVLAEVAADDLETWCQVVAEAGELQRRVAARAEQLLEVGLSRLAPDDAAAYVRARSAQLAALPPDDPRRITPDEAAAARSHAPDLDRWAESELALGLPETLQHSDLHEHNIFAGSRMFFDFGDAVLSTPLGVLLIPIVTLSRHLSAGPTDERLWRVADAYLEVWTDLVPLASLRAALPAALRLARLARLESWLRVSASLHGDAMAEYGDIVPAWLRLVPEPPPLALP